MSEAGVIALVTAVLTFIASIASAAMVSIGNRNKTIRAVEDAIQSVKTDSKAQDEEIHAEILLFKQETSGALDLIRKDISTLSDRVEKHNGVIDRVYRLEADRDLHAEKISNLERSGK